MGIYLFNVNKNSFIIMPYVDFYIEFCISYLTALSETLLMIINAEIGSLQI